MQLPIEHHTIGIDLDFTAATWQQVSSWGSTRPGTVTIATDPKTVYSFIVIAKNAGNWTQSTPIRIYTGPSTDEKAVALSLLTSEESKHASQPYYSALNPGKVLPGFEALFDEESKALNYVDVAYDDSTHYSSTLSKLYIQRAGVPVGVIHELVHAVDDFAGWNDTHFNLQRSEVYAYVVDNMLSTSSGYLDGVPNTLLDMLSAPYTTVAAAQTHWDRAWKRLNSLVGSLYKYYFFPDPVQQIGNLSSADVTEVFGKLGIRLSASALLPLYNKILEGEGLPPNALTNTFSFVLDPAFA